MYNNYLQNLNNSKQLKNEKEFIFRIKHSKKTTVNIIEIMFS